MYVLDNTSTGLYDATSMLMDNDRRCTICSIFFNFTILAVNIVHLQMLLLAQHCIVRQKFAIIVTVLSPFVDAQLARGICVQSFVLIFPSSEIQGCTSCIRLLYFLLTDKGDSRISSNMWRKSPRGWRNKLRATSFP